ncbi:TETRATRICOPEPTIDE-LIKE HELICAL DOMAIN-CONTAINING PROTEIN-RELATED [Salix koriyanagi]|uniref:TETRATRICOPEPTIDE-LIKE HELICAL DOMAIN-CONTAINING PROTEIN-RELATED n=1 Tax=Salix koriyanagi TaxID=2511006 RepID=A0A9Q0TQL6_9ROSI|nr:TETRATRICOPEPTIDE-LIKE HELICAL DOMAIN-CONTAINING PROTEIN-RELATED [Salix koriyanagi]
MGVKVATTTYFQWSQPIIHHSPSSSQTLASAVSSPSSKGQRRLNGTGGGVLLCRCLQRLDRWTLFGTPLTNLQRARSYEFPKSRGQTIKRASSASLDAFSDEEFSKKIQELALRFQLSDDEDDGSDAVDSESEILSHSGDNLGEY